MQVIQISKDILFIYQDDECLQRLIRRLNMQCRECVIHSLVDNGTPVNIDTLTVVEGNGVREEHYISYIIQQVSGNAEAQYEEIEGNLCGLSFQGCLYGLGNYDGKMLNYIQSRVRL